MSFQNQVAAAMPAVFHDDPTDIAERIARFMEEANELAQSFGMHRHALHELVDYTYDRPVGDREKEIGGVMVTLASLCVVANTDMEACGAADLTLFQMPATIERIRKKRATRHGRGALPGISPNE